MLSGFPDLNVMADTKAKILSYNIILYCNIKVLLWEVNFLVCEKSTEPY